MKKRIGAITIILIIISILIGIRLLLISIDISKFNTSCAILEEKMKNLSSNYYHYNISVDGNDIQNMRLFALNIQQELEKRDLQEMFSEDYETLWLSCILQQKDTNINQITTLYLLIISILLTLLSWKIDKLKTN